MLSVIIHFCDGGRRDYSRGVRIQITRCDQKSGPKPGQDGFIDLTPLLRLVLLVIPMVITVKTLSHHPLWCVLACVAVLAAWLFIDVWPFRASKPAGPKQGKAETSKSS